MTSVTTEQGVVKVIIAAAAGREVYRPLCENAKMFAALAKQRTLTAREIETIKKLGFKVLAIAEAREL